MELRCAIIGSLAVIALVCDAGLVQGQDREPDKGTVALHVVDSFGGTLKPFRVSLTALTGESTGLAFQNGRFTGVPYGKYRVTVVVGNFRTTEREIFVERPMLWVVVGLPFAPGDRVSDAGWLRLTGTVRGVPASGAQWWARVAGVFLPDTFEVPIDSGGHFNVEGLSRGSYLLEIYEGSKMRAVRQFDIDSKSQELDLVVDLAKK